jgi:hypothetical protein
MAMMIRDQNKLLALQLQLLAQPDGEVVSASLFEGPEPIGAPMALPAADFGLPQGCDARALESASLSLPERLTSYLRAASDSRLGPRDPLWLYIPRGAGKLALFPWEAEIWRAIGKPLLRLPNFLDDPFEAGSTLEIALAISLPADSGVAFPKDQLVALLAALGGQNPPHDDIVLHIFADAGLEDRITSIIAAQTSAAGLRIAVHAASTADDTVPPGSGPAPSRKRSSPWLRWMARRLEGKTIDLVHFICPAYYAETGGGLALQQSRLIEGDPLWTRLIGADEVCAVLDPLGANAVSFAAIGPGGWQRAAGRMAFELSWRRPGPVIAQPWDAGPEQLAAPLRLICGTPDIDIDLLKGTVFTCHPRHLMRGRSSTRGAALESVRPERSAIDQTLRNVAKGRDPGGSENEPESAISAQLEYRTFWTPDAPSASGAERVVGRYLRKSQANLSTLERTSRVQRLELEGAAKALDLVDRLLTDAKQLGTTGTGQ